MVTAWLSLRLVLSVPAAAQDTTVVPPPTHGPAGVACEHCHDDPHQGTATGGCQRCHGAERWSPAAFSVADHAQTRFPLEGRHQRVACGLCHLDRHRGKLGTACETCHAPAGFVPSTVPFDHEGRTNFALTGVHADVACASCHQGPNGDAMRLVPQATCATCHDPGHATFTAGPASMACTACHTLTTPTFTAATFDHRREASFPLERRHAAQPCAACHPPGGSAPDARCQSCHLDVHSGQLGTACDDCHRPDRWRVVRFDHDRTMFPLRGRHFVTACASCHTGERWVGLTEACWDCHALDVRRAPASVPAHTLGLTACDDCHSLWSWR